MPIESLQPIDNPDDRREIFRILQLFDPQARVDFLCWCAGRAQCLRPDGSRVLFVVTHSTGEPAEVYWDLMMMIAGQGMELRTMLCELERRARKAARAGLLSPAPA